MKHDKGCGAKCSEPCTCLPAAECLYGYPWPQLKLILKDRYLHFVLWMNSQTVTICDGTKYNHETKQYELTLCGPHGSVVYKWDLERFLAGRPIID